MRIQGKGAQLQIRGMRSAGQGDEQARFLSDLRALRDMAAIGYDELAARAHYPSDVLKEAENGPLLPGLPVLTAYVRACEGDVLDWEERWRRLARVAAEDPGLPVRPPGASPAAVAGARAGVGVAPPDVYDPDRIRAALRGGHERSDRNGRRNGDPGIAAPAKGPKFTDHEPAGWDAEHKLAGWDADLGQDLGGWQDASAGVEADAALGADAAAGADPGPAAGTTWNGGSSWDSGADPTVTMANGNHSPKYDSYGSQEMAAAEPDERDGQTEQFRWLPDGESESRSNDADFTWSGHVETTQTNSPSADADPWPAAANPWSAGTELAGTELAGTELAGTGLAGTGLAGTGLAGIDASPAEPAANGRPPRDQEEVLATPDRDDFWATPTPPAPADLQLASPSPRQVEEPRAAFGSAGLAQTAAIPAAGARQPGTDSAPSIRESAPTSARASAEPARHEKDRFFPVRLLVIIVIAALIGSALVLLLK
jgi:hypothetical protein